LRTYFKANFLFLKEILTHPRAIGAAFPSSKYLARAMVAHIPKLGTGYVVELGPGTGAITKQILRSGIDSKRLIVVEISPRLVKHLKEKFPDVNIVEGNAENLDTLLGDKIANVDCIVSSLPLKSLPKSTVKNIISKIDKVLSIGGVYIQFTYGVFFQKKVLSSKMQHIFSKIVWWNFPPAAVNVAKKILF